MTNRNGVLNSLEQWSPSAFLIGGLLLAVDAAWLAANISMGGENYLLTGQLFVGTGWTVALLGLLGIYPALSDTSRLLSRMGAICTVIGIMTFAAMAILVFIDISGIVAGVYEPIGTFFIPGVIIGSVLGFVAFSMATFRTQVHSRTFAVLLLVPPILVLSNILRFVAGYSSETVTLIIVIADALSILMIGYYLRSQSTFAPPKEPTQSAA